MRRSFPRAILIAVLIAGWTAVPLRAPASPRAIVCFYSAESSIDNLSSLKDEFDAYLSEHGQYEFNPSGDVGMFESCAAGPDRGVFLVSSWHYRSLRETHAIEPVLIGVAGDRSARKRVLCVRKDVGSLDALKGAQIASAGSKEFTAAMLAQMVGPDGGDFLTSARMLIVPKDIDALMAVGYGMAKAAFTTENSLDLLERINPKLAGQLVPLIRSSDILLPIVAAPRDPNEETAILLKVLEEMGDRPEGEKRLKLLGLDRWKRLGESERRSLEQ